MRNFAEPRGDEPVDELGLPIRVHYTLVGTIAFFVGSVSLLFAVTPAGAQLRHPVVIAICLTGMAVPACFALLARRASYEFKESMIMAVLLLAVLGPFICHFFIGALRPAFLTLYMLGPIGAAYYAPMGRAWPVTALGAGAIMIVSAHIDEPDAMMRGVIVATITVSSSLMLAAIREHLVRTVESNQEISERDPLTGAFNLHKFQDRLNYEIELSKDGGSGFALVEFDLDHFKEVNEAYNHSVGDDVLIAAAESIQSVLTPIDLLVRRGGDEFVVIAPFLPERNLHAMTLLARDRIAAARRALCPDLTPIASAGWAFHDHEESAEAVIQRADDSLHESKRAAKLMADESIMWRDLRESQGPDRYQAPASIEVIELRRRRAEEAAIGDDPMAGAMRIAWRTAAYVTLVLCAVIFAMGETGHLSFAFTPTIYAVLAAWTFVMAPLAFWSTLDTRPAYFDHVLAVASFSLITLTCLAVGDASPALVELYMLAALLYLTLLPFRVAIGYVVLSYTLYAAFVFERHYPASDIRVATTLVSFAFIGLILALTRNRAIKAADEKATLARTDALTGLPNLRSLRGWLTTEIAHCEANGGGFALIALDLDDFKAVNDLHGYSAGDAVLNAVADALRQTAGQADLPVRRGGDEFILVLTGANERDAAAAAERIAETIRFTRARIAPDAAPTTSVSWVIWRSGEDAEDLLDRADDALHDAKLEMREAHLPETETA